MLICFASDLPTCKHFQFVLFSPFHPCIKTSGVCQGCTLGPILFHVLMLSAIPIVSPVVSYFVRILMSSIMFVSLGTVKSCSSILTLFKNESWTNAGK